MLFFGHRKRFALSIYFTFLFRKLSCCMSMVKLLRSRTITACYKFILTKGSKATVLKFAADCGTLSLNTLGQRLTNVLLKWFSLSRSENFWFRKMNGLIEEKVSESKGVGKTSEAIEGTQWIVEHEMECCEFACVLGQCAAKANPARNWTWVSIHGVSEWASLARGAETCELNEWRLTNGAKCSECPESKRKDHETKWV
jgi:hypothetical protein